MAIFRVSLAFILFLVLSTAGAQNFVPVPALQSRVTDQAGMLTSAQRATLENVLKDYEERTGSQIAILLVSKTEPEAIEQYSIRVADAWKLGRKGVDDGVLLLVAKDNPPALRRLRIEAGRGVQGTLTDAQSKRILQDVIAPHFRQNDFYGGLAAGTSAIGSLLNKEQLPAPNGKQAMQNESTSGTFSVLLFFGILIFFFLLSRRRTFTTYGSRNSGWGHGAGIILGSAIGNQLGRGSWGGSWNGSSGGGGWQGGESFSGGGGSADGGGASGNW